MPQRRFIPYRPRATFRARSLRRDATAAEKKLWFEYLRDLPDKFTRQKPLGRYIADFYCSSRRLVIELDGDSHFNDPAQRYDECRSAALMREGLRVVRFTNIEVMESFEAVCAAIGRALSASGE